MPKLLVRNRVESQRLHGPLRGRRLHRRRESKGAVSTVNTLCPQAAVELPDSIGDEDVVDLLLNCKRRGFFGAAD
jgi:hypothetical protein